MINRITFTLLIFASLSLVAKTVELEKSKAKVSFSTSAHPGGVQIPGEATNAGDTKPIKGKYDVDGKELSGSFEVSLKDLDTGITLRNNHMKEKHLEVEKYPTALLEIPKTVLKADGESPFKGTMSLHGQKQPVEGTATYKGKTLALDFHLKLTDYKIDPPKFMGITVKEDIHVQAESTEN